MATSNTRPFLIGNTVCFRCKSRFVIRNPYFGTNPMCPACRASRGQRIVPKVPQLSQQSQVAQAVPPLGHEWVMHANAAEFTEANLTETSINWKWFEYPMRSCESGDGYWVIRIGDPNLDVDVLLNRDTLKESKVYFSQVGRNDGEDWIFIIKRPDGIYVYFRASCDYTGFDCRGGGIISYARDWKTFWNMCLDTLGRSRLQPANSDTN